MCLHYGIETKSTPFQKCLSKNAKHLASIQCKGRSIDHGQFGLDPISFLLSIPFFSFPSSPFFPSFEFH